MTNNENIIYPCGGKCHLGRTCHTSSILKNRDKNIETHMIIKMMILILAIWISLILILFFLAKLNGMPYENIDHLIGDGSIKIFFLYKMAEEVFM